MLGNSHILGGNVEGLGFSAQCVVEFVDCLGLQKKGAIELVEKPAHITFPVSASHSPSARTA